MPGLVGARAQTLLPAAAIADDPDPDVFEGWLLERWLKRADAASPRALRAMARDILAAAAGRGLHRLPGLAGAGRAVRRPRSAHKRRSERPG